LNVANLTDLLGGAAAYVGFTGFGSGSQQSIANFSFLSFPTVTVSAAAGQVVIGWSAASAG
jgi:hypothetical protein